MRGSAIEIVRWLPSLLLEKMTASRTRAQHDYSNAFVKSARDFSSLLEMQGRRLCDASILDLGCGYNYPETLLLSNVARQVTGIDVRTAFWKDGFRALYDYNRDNGNSLLRALIRAFLERQTYRGYYDHLRKLSGRDLDELHQDVRTYDGVHLPFSDESFDIVWSNSVFEHVDPGTFPELVKETARVTKQSGIACHLWHNYFSLFGAHVIAGLAMKHPWGHLLKNPEVEAWIRFTKAFSNGMHPEEVVRLMSPYFRCEALYYVDMNQNKRDVDSNFSFEGERLLSQELEEKLSEYPRDLLLTRAFMFIGHKRD